MWSEGEISAVLLIDDIFWKRRCSICFLPNALIIVYFLHHSYIAKSPGDHPEFYPPTEWPMLTLLKGARRGEIGQNIPERSSFNPSTSPWHAPLTTSSTREGSWTPSLPSSILPFTCISFVLRPPSNPYTVPMCVCVCVCVSMYIYIKLHITTQSGPVMSSALCYMDWHPSGGIKRCVFLVCQKVILCTDGGILIMRGRFPVNRRPPPILEIKYTSTLLKSYSFINVPGAMIHRMRWAQTDWH